MKKKINTNIDFITKNHEFESIERDRYSKKRLGKSYQSIGILGGGTAGYLTALALQKTMPHLNVCLIESSRIPVIGVGEATTTQIIDFLHGFLKIDIHDLYREVQPTWKQGIRFEWGQPGEYFFDAPFDWGVGHIGIHGAKSAAGNIRDFSLGAMLMRNNATSILKVSRNRYESYLPALPPAYHLDNVRLIKFLKKTALARGVKWIDCEIENINYSESSQRVSSLLAKDGRELKFDLYVDCSGFRSLLLEKTLKTPFIDFESSLYNDRALTFQMENDRKPRPYTTARTMQSGWCWEIPMRETDHCGYVHSSRFCTPEEAEKEIKKTYPRLLGIQNMVQFRSGRHTKAWRGNVLAIGNAFAFVEPLESTGLLMICRQIQDFISLFPETIGEESGLSEIYNRKTVDNWDRLRWFLSVHFRFNKKIDSKYWETVRAETDISGIQHLVELFKQGSPLSLRFDPSMLGTIPFYGIEGLDCILMGQQVESRLIERFEPKAKWTARKKFAVEFVKKAMPQHEALEAIENNPWILDDFLEKIVKHQ